MLSTTMWNLTLWETPPSALPVHTLFVLRRIPGRLPKRHSVRPTRSSRHNWPRRRSWPSPLARRRPWQRGKKNRNRRSPAVLRLARGKEEEDKHLSKKMCLDAMFVEGGGRVDYNGHAWTRFVLRCAWCQREQIAEGGKEEEDKCLPETTCLNAALVAGGGKGGDNSVAVLGHASYHIAHIFLPLLNMIRISRSRGNDTWAMDLVFSTHGRLATDIGPCNSSWDDQGCSTFCRCCRRGPTVANIERDNADINPPCTQELMKRSCGHIAETPTKMIRGAVGWSGRDVNRGGTCFFNGPKNDSEFFNMLSYLTIIYPECFVEFF